jgi:hypothetical protein
MTGTMLGHYEIGHKLGEGGMGAVYLARDTRLRRDVAIKMLPADVASAPDRLSRFEREAHVLASLNHPNIATLHGFEELGGVPVLVMELVAAQTLRVWNPDGTELFYRNGPGMMAVAIHDAWNMIVGRPQLLYERRSGRSLIRGFDVTPDGRSFIDLDDSGGGAPANGTRARAEFRQRAAAARPARALTIRAARFKRHPRAARRRWGADARPARFIARPRKTPEPATNRR